MPVPAEYEAMTSWLHACRRPLLLTHRRPDGDALGALAGLALGLRQLGPAPRVALYEPFPPRYAVLADSLAWDDRPAAARELIAACDAVVVVDTSSYQQLAPVADLLSTAPRTLVVDHHATADPIGTRAGDCRVTDVSASAVCVLIAEWMEQAGLAFTPEIAVALFTGIATDCGWFRFSSTDARTLRMAADLVGAGAAPNAIHAAIYEQDAPAKLHLIGRMLQSLELFAGGQLAAMYIRQADFEAVGADSHMTEDVVNEAARLGCTEATLLFTEEPHDIRVNFRSKRRLDVSALAAQYGGGGHARAAGARLTGPWEQVVPPVIQAAVAALEAMPAGAGEQEQRRGASG